MDISIDKDELRRRLLELPAFRAQAVEEEVDEPVVEPVRTPAVKRASYEPLIYAGLCIVVLIVSFTTWFAMTRKPQPTATVMPETKAVSSEYQQVLANQGQLKSQVTELGRKVDVIVHRQWLQGVIHNENTAINQGFVKQYNPTLSQKYISFDHEWMLNKAPEYLKMSDEDRKELLESVRKKD